MALKSILIGYDLNKPHVNYTELIDKIKSLANGWWHHLDSTWIIRTEHTPVQVCEQLRPHIDSNDEMLVIDVTADAAAWCGFNKSGSDWLKDNL